MSNQEKIPQKHISSLTASNPSQKQSSNSNNSKKNLNFADWFTWSIPNWKTLKNSYLQNYIFDWINKKVSLYMKENHKNLCKNLIEEQELIREIKKKEKVSYSLENRIKIGMIIIL